nr:MAG TPA: hypothetical protein [Caudoviricetes sp.]
MADWVIPRTFARSVCVSERRPASARMLEARTLTKSTVLCGVSGCNVTVLMWVSYAKLASFSKQFDSF